MRARIAFRRHAQVAVLITTLGLPSACSLVTPFDGLEGPSGGASGTVPTDAGADADVTADAGPPVPPEPRIVHFHFDGDARDVSGNGRDGLLQGGASVSGAGVWGGALLCDGDGDVLSVSGDYKPGSGSFTVALFFRVRLVNGRAAKELNTLFVKGSAWETSQNLAPGFGFGYNDGLGGGPPSVTAFVRDATTRVRVELEYPASGTPPPPARDGKFHHVALAVDRSAALASLYIDGEKVAETGIPTALGSVDSSDPARLCGETAPTLGLDGAIDEAVVIGRALSAAEVRLLAARR